MKIAAICSGGDWCDASVTHVTIPETMNLAEEYKRYEEWWQDLRRKRSNNYATFAEWLVSQRAAGLPAETELIEFLGIIFRLRKS